MALLDVKEVYGGNGVSAPANTHSQMLAIGWWTTWVGVCESNHHKYTPLSNIAVVRCCDLLVDVPKLQPLLMHNH